MEIINTGERMLLLALLLLENGTTAGNNDDATHCNDNKYLSTKRPYVDKLLMLQPLKQKVMTYKSTYIAYPDVTSVPLHAYPDIRNIFALVNCCCVCFLQH